MALSASQRAENRKDLASGKAPRHLSALTADPNQTVDTSYGSPEQIQILGNRTRVNETEVVLQDLGILA